MHFFLCANFSMMIDMCFSNLMAGMKSNIVHMNNPRGVSCNIGKYTPSLLAYKKCVRFLFCLPNQSIYLGIIYWLWSGLLWFGMITVLICMLIIFSGIMIVILFVSTISRETRKGWIVMTSGAFIRTHYHLKFFLCLLF